MKEKIEEQEKVIVDGAIEKINKFLPYPKSLSITHESNSVFYNMATGRVDESGGGSVHDGDYYTFKAEDLSKLILDAESSGLKRSAADIEAYRNTDYVDWPYGRVDGSEIHKDNEKVKLHLGFAKRDDMNVFVVNENEFEIPPQINTDGFILLLNLGECKKKAKYAYGHMVYSFLGDPIIPDFGNLNDLETPCKLVFDDYLTPETSSDGDYSEERKRILYFDKAMVIEALSKFKTGDIVKVKGPGRAKHFLERAGYGYNRNQNTVEIDIDILVEVTMSIFSSNLKSFQIKFDSKPIDTNESLHLERNIILSSRGA